MMKNKIEELRNEDTRVVVNQTYRGYLWMRLYPRNMNPRMIVTNIVMKDKMIRDDEKIIVSVEKSYYDWSEAYDPSDGIIRFDK